MADFKAVVNDPKTGKSYQVEVAGPQTSALIGKKIGDIVDGIYFKLPGYKLQITGGSDKDGFPMRHDLPGQGRRKLMLSGGVGFKPDRKGVRKRKNVRGNTVSPSTLQLNLKITTFGPTPVSDILQKKESK
ncbi:MAG: 30S ribosomal protein S6e [Thermoplasmata archaeon]|uniref:Small ribosomal subunit protein eS6 n=1 Tax=Candidatus Sysuiplasma superficiale TaxID=2823368 RepID=A0A8J8CB35_9ARCH|nr:30S ribosomal protein S6e [Candidatus Sysuiplasma superficiale]MBX8643306.1 30S ribosomal protein S6e [Candidatus Sysuiplasma superficiale]MCL4346384.1 30S ribosomal protein S6e [Candidatus Thermoplasmatota archaeon]MCL5437160.1 30S ribosomal protein S6e [Candidatus Thermoplasmatota archaeon]